MTQIWTSHSTEDLAGIARDMMAAVPEARIFGFWGNLGAGKTTFIKVLCELLGVEGDVTSPTFNLVNTYEGTDADIHHFDFYRIEKEEELQEIGLDEYLDSGDFCFIEWPERILSSLPEEMIVVEISSKGPTERLFELKEFMP